MGKPNLTTKKKIKAVLATHPGYDQIKVGVETGILHCRTTRVLTKIFPTVHAIELSTDLLDAAPGHVNELLLPGRNSITFHSGDSAEMLPNVVGPLVEEPALFYLSAYRMAGALTAKSRDLPLDAELTYIKDRLYADVILVDREQLFGEWRWGTITMDAVETILGTGTLVGGVGSVVGRWGVFWRTDRT